MASPPRSSASTSPPVDPSKLNQTPAPLPIPVPSRAAHTEPLRDMGGMGGMGGGGGGSGAVPADSAYLDMPEPASHPTVAETGMLGSSLGAEPGPKTGQLARRESDANREIIKLSSFGGEGLQIKPPHMEGP